jgi:pleiotropic regulator 1
MAFKICKKWSRIKILLENSSKINTIAILESKSIFATGSSDSNIQLWDKIKCHRISVLKSQQGSINKILLDKKTGNLISGGEGTSLFSWNIEYEKVVRIFRGHISSINCIDIHPTLNIMVSGSRDNTIRIWDLRMKKEAIIIKHHKDQITSVLFSNETPHLISSSKDSRICLWDIVAFQCTNCLISHPSGVKEIKRHPTELKFASLCAYNLNLWRLDGIKIKKFKILKNIAFFSFKNKDEFIAIDNSGWMKFYKWRNSRGFFNFRFGFFPFDQDKKKNPTSMEFNSEGDEFIVCNNVGEIGLFKSKWFIQTQ